MRKNLIAIPVLALLAVPALTACGSGSSSSKSFSSSSRRK